MITKILKLIGLCCVSLLVYIKNVRETIFMMHYDQIISEFVFPLSAENHKFIQYI